MEGPREREAREYQRWTNTAFQNVARTHLKTHFPVEIRACAPESIQNGGDHDRDGGDDNNDDDDDGDDDDDDDENGDRRNTSRLYGPQ